MVGVVEEDGGVNRSATEADLEVEVGRGGTARLPREPDDLTGLHLLSYFHEVFRLMAVAGGEAVSVADDDVVAVAVIRSRLYDDTVEGRQHLVVGLGLDVHARMTAPAAPAIRTDDMGAGERIGPVLLLYLLQVEGEHGAVVEVAVVVVVRIEVEAFLLLGVEDRYRHVAARLSALQHLLPQAVTLRLQEGFSIDLATIDHDGEEAEGSAVVTTDDGDGLSGFHTLSHADEVLRVVGIDGFEAVVVADNDGVAMLWRAAGETDGTAEHRFHRVAFGRRYLQGTVLDRCLTDRQRKRIFIVAEDAEVDVESVAL